MFACLGVITLMPPSTHITFLCIRNQGSVLRGFKVPLSIAREACHEQIACAFVSRSALEMSVPFMLLIVNVFLLHSAFFAMQDMVLCCW